MCGKTTKKLVSENYWEKKYTEHEYEGIKANWSNITPEDFAETIPTKNLDKNNSL